MCLLDMEAAKQLLLEYPELMFSGFGATAVVAGGALIYKLSSRKKPSHASVNCWFCNQNNVVPYGNRNCWDCPNCDQYNGFQQNGDYNKPIPAQYMEHLNHGVSGNHPSPPKTLQWVNCQMLLCRKCNNNQTLKIKQLASFIPRDDENYDEEIEAYKHHLEQTYKLCRPCQAAVEYYIKYQNRQLRTVLLNHQLRRSRDTDKAIIKSPYAAACPTAVILLRILAFLICAFFSASSYIDLADQSTSPNDAAVPPPATRNESASETQRNGTVHVWQELLQLFPENALEKSKAALQYGKDNTIVVVSLGLFTCLTGIFLGGPTRLRRIDAVASVLWFLILCLHMAESYTAGASDWMDTAKLSAVFTCCLVSFGAAVATRKQLGSRRGRYRRYFPSSFQTSLPVSDLTDTIVLTPPPNLCHLINQQRPQERRASPTSLPGRLHRALRLGTIPTLTRTDSGYLFSGSRPQSVYKDSPSSDYFSLKSVSRPSSPGPSPTPSVAGSVTSSSGSARFRRPLISPARLNISGQKLRLFSTETESTRGTPPVSPSQLSHEPTSSNYNTCFSSDIFPLHNSTFSFRDGSVLEEEKKGSSSGSSACLVDTTTQGPDTTSSGKNFWRRVIWPGLLMTSLSTNLVFASVYMYNNWR
ncbi:transmembrane protein 201 [Eucyclogobius newberryi]|uniref:transmembrane protein 201 n=1 Tax=Eucyclogobius newberryi TaxID=166745 RepID=UPI003B58F7C7